MFVSVCCVFRFLFLKNSLTGTKVKKVRGWPAEAPRGEIGSQPDLLAVSIPTSPGADPRIIGGPVSCEPVG